MKHTEKLIIVSMAHPLIKEAGLRRMVGEGLSNVGRWTGRAGERLSDAADEGLSGVGKEIGRLGYDAVGKGVQGAGKGIVGTLKGTRSLARGGYRKGKEIYEDVVSPAAKNVGGKARKGILAGVKGLGERLQNLGASASDAGIDLEMAHRKGKGKGKAVQTEGDKLKDRLSSIFMPADLKEKIKAVFRGRGD